MKASKNIENLRLNSNSTLKRNNISSKHRLLASKEKGSEYLINEFQSRKEKSCSSFICFSKCKKRTNQLASTELAKNQSTKYKLIKFKKITAAALNSNELDSSKTLSYLSSQEGLNNQKQNKNVNKNQLLGKNKFNTKRRNSEINSNSTSSYNRKLTIMLMTVSISFCITSMPIVTLQSIEQAGLLEQSKILSLIKGIFLVLQYLNHSINFFLYAITGKTFRREFIALFSTLRCCQAKNNMNRNESQFIMDRSNRLYSQHFQSRHYKLSNDSRKFKNAVV
jgi:hypothetical protein